jgi:exonuclease III
MTDPASPRTKTLLDQFAVLFSQMKDFTLDEQQYVFSEIASMIDEVPRAQLIKDEPEQNTIRMVTWNLGGITEGATESIKVVQSVINTNHLNLVCLQETREGVAEKIQKGLGVQEWGCTSIMAGQGYQCMEYTVILFKLSCLTRVDREWKVNQGFFVRLPLVLELSFGAFKIIVSNFHLKDGTTKKGKEQLDQELHNLASFVQYIQEQKEKGTVHIVTGDFNRPFDRTYFLRTQSNVSPPLIDHCSTEKNTRGKNKYDYAVLVTDKAKVTIAYEEIKIGESETRLNNRHQVSDHFPAAFSLTLEPTATPLVHEDPQTIHER